MKDVRLFTVTRVYGLQDGKVEFAFVFRSADMRDCDHNRFPTEFIPLQDHREVVVELQNDAAKWKANAEAALHANRDLRHRISKLEGRERIVGNLLSNAADRIESLHKNIVDSNTAIVEQARAVGYGG